MCRPAACRLSREWEALRDTCPKLPHRARLYRPYAILLCPEYRGERRRRGGHRLLLEYRRCTTSLAADAAARRSLARHWNDLARTVPGWPSQLLFEPPSRKAEAFPPWEAYPIGLRYEIEAYLESLTRVRKTPKGKRVPPARATTIRGRRAMLEAALRMATPDRHRHGGTDLTLRLSRSRR